MNFIKKFEKSVDKPILYMLQWLCFGSLAQLGEHLPYKQEVIGSIPITSTKLNHSSEWFFNTFAEVVEWQTRRTQNPLIAISCGFKSRLRHQTLSCLCRIFLFFSIFCIFLKRFCAYIGSFF